MSRERTIARYLAIDAGAKRTGLAVGDDGCGIATPLPLITTTSPAERLRQIQLAITQQGPDALILGLPLNMDESEGPAARAMRVFAGQLHEATGLPVLLVDERLTSEAANDQMARSGLTHGQKKARRDSLAAGHLLRHYFTHGAVDQIGA